MNRIDQYIYSKLKTEEKDEFAKYLTAPLTPNPKGQIFDILEWWKLRQKEYPILSMVARDYLGIPASSAFVERVFSRAGHLLSDDRLSMKEDTIREIMCVDYWFRQEYPAE
jgi:hypothetical protein